MDIKDFTSSVPISTDEKILHIYPILFDGHISIFYFIDYNNKRAFFLSDPSHVHSKNVKKDSYINGFIFPKNMRKSTQLRPEEKIQRFNSCTLWFYFQMLIIINHDETIQQKYEISKDVIFSFKNSTIYYECINYYQKLMGYKKMLLEINPNTDSLDPDYIYYIPSEQYTYLNKVRIYKYSFLNEIVDIIKLIEIMTDQDVSSEFGFEEMKTFQNYYENFIDFILLLNYNLNYFKLNDSKSDNKSIIKVLELALKNMENHKSSFVNLCLNYFDKIIKENKYHIDKKDRQTFNLVSTEKEEVLKIAKEYNLKFENFKNDIKEKIILYSSNITSKILFPIVGGLYNSK